MESKTKTSKAKLLFTPGPLTTSETVKKAMLIDYGSRDTEFIEMVYVIRNKLLETGNVKKGDNYEAVIMQGSGTFGIESVLTSAVPTKGHLLVLSNGAYGERIIEIANLEGLHYSTIKYAENETPSVKDVKSFLDNDSSVTHVAMVHCETTTGIMNPISDIGELLNELGTVFIVDAMSSFGGTPIDIEACKIDFLISSANKCIEGVPGFSFVIAKTERLLKTSGNSKNLSLDLYAQWMGLEKNGQFRFTPPTHAIAAFYQALMELDEEGGVAGRSKRYLTNYKTLVSGMRNLGFTEYLQPEKQGHLITSFHYPEHINFDFDTFYSSLADKGFVIYPGKVSKVDCFRIGTIGRIFPKDIESLLEAIAQTLDEMNIYIA